MANLESGTVNAQDALDGLKRIENDIEAALSASEKIVRTLEQLKDTNNLNVIEQAHYGADSVDKLLQGDRDVMEKIKKDTNAWLDEFNEVDNMQADF